MEVKIVMIAEKLISNRRCKLLEIVVTRVLPRHEIREKTRFGVLTFSLLGFRRNIHGEKCSLDLGEQIRSWVFCPKNRSGGRTEPKSLRLRKI